MTDTTAVSSGAALRGTGDHAVGTRRANQVLQEDEADG